MPNYVKIALVKISSFVTVKRFFKHLLFIILSIFLSHQISASSPFFSIEKRVDRVYNLVNGVVKSADELIASVDDVYKTILKADLDASDDLLKLLGKQPELLDSWKVLSKGKKSLRSVDNINAISLFKKSNPDVSLTELKKAIESLKSSRKQSFVNGLKNVANNDLLALTNKRLATIYEVKDALNNLRNFRKLNSSLSDKINIAYLEGKINGRSMSEL